MWAIKSLRQSPHFVWHALHFVDYLAMGYQFCSEQPTLCLHILSSPSLRQGIWPPKWQTFFNFVSSRTCQESGRWDSCRSIHCWAATWCHMRGWHHLECHTLQKTASRCKQHEHLWFYSIIIHSQISKA